MIRRAVADDIEAIEAMDKVCFPFDKPYMFAWKKNVSWVVEELVDDEKTIIAYLSAHPLGRMRWFFSRVGVLPVARGRGLQRKLMGTLEKHGRAAGWKEIVTYTVAINGWSTRNILACGYRTYEPRKSYVGWDVIHMRKRLA